jgi:acetyl esterase/lipase
MNRRAIPAVILTTALAPGTVALGRAQDAQTRQSATATRTYKSDPVDTAHGDREFLLLWPEGAPGAMGDLPADKPKITVYRAPADKANGAGMIVCPGGGYRNLASDHEGKQVAEWMNTLGLSAFVVQYRVGPRYRHPAPFQDAQRALRLVRSKAKDFGLDGTRLGIIGFSAGGHLASATGTRFDEGVPHAPDPVERMSSRPDFMILAYPVISLASPFTHKGSLASLLGDRPDPRLMQELSTESRVTPRTPPTFLFHTADDPTVPAENSIAFYSALRAANVAAELHVFAHGPHGVGLAQQDHALSAWPRLCAAWMDAMGFLRPR